MSGNDTLEISREPVGLVGKGIAFVKNHPLTIRAMAGVGTLAMVAGPVAAADSFGMNSTQVDAMFSILNNSILPDVGQTISALPAVIIPIVILIVLIVILLFIPELLYSLLDMLKSAFKMSGKR